MSSDDLAPAASGDGRREIAGDQIRILRGAKGCLIEHGLDLLRRTGLLWRVNFTVHGSWLGAPVAIPMVFGNGIQHVRSGERWMYDVLRRLLRLRAGAFVDVGANLGQTLLKVKMHDRRRAYYGFEPNPVAASYLLQLIERNAFPASQVFPIGLSDGPRVARLLSQSDADPSASIVEGFRPASRYCRSQPVAVERGDDILGAACALPIAVVKIDVEGAELDVLNGLRRTVAEHEPSIVCEVLPVYDPTTDAGRLRVRRQAELWRLLKSMGYLVYRISRCASAEPVDGFGVHSDVHRSNYLFLPSRTDVSAALDYRT